MTHIDDSSSQSTHNHSSLASTPHSILPWTLHKSTSTDHIQKNTPHTKYSLLAQQLNQSQHHQVHLDADWYQGRGVYGGLVAAMLMEAMLTMSDSFLPRTLTIHFCVPAVAGDAHIEISIIRTGKKVRHLQARTDLCFFVLLFFALS